MAFSNQYGGVPQITPASTGARMMLEALNSASTSQPKNYFALAGDLAKIGGQFWQDYNDNDARQAMMQYTDSKELQDAIASGKLDLSETSTKFQKEASEHIKGLADTKLAQVNAEKNQYELTKERQHEEAITKASPIINEMRRLMTTGSPADFQQAMKLALQIDDARILKEIGINPTEDFRAERELKINEQRANTEAYEANLRAKRLDLEIKDKEEVRARELAQRYIEQGITPLTAEGTAILKNALGSHFDTIFPMGYTSGGEEAARKVGTESSTASQEARKQIDLTTRRIAQLAETNPYTEAFDSLTAEAKESLEKSIKGNDIRGLSETIIKHTLGLTDKELRPHIVAEFAEDIGKLYQEVKKENPNVNLHDLAAVMLNSNEAFEKNSDIVGGSIGTGYYDFKAGSISGLGFKIDRQKIKAELSKSSQSNVLALQAKEYQNSIDALTSRLTSLDMKAKQLMSISGHNGSVDSKKLTELTNEYIKVKDEIITQKKALEDLLGSNSERDLDKDKKSK